MMSDEDRKLFDRMNKRLETFDKRGIKNNIVGLVRHELMNIYLNEQEKNETDLHRTNFSKFTMNSNISDETLEELRGLAQALEKTKSSTMRYYKKHPTVAGNVEKSFEVLKGKQYGVKDFQSFVNFVDDLDEAMQDKVMSEKLDSNQWARIYGYGKDKDFTTDEINDLITKNITSYRDGETYVTFITSVIDEKYADKNKNKNEDEDEDE